MITHSDGIVYWRVLPSVLDLDVLEEPSFNEELHDLVVAFAASQMQRCPIVIITLADVVVSHDLVLHDEINRFSDFDQVAFAGVGEQIVMVIKYV